MEAKAFCPAHVTGFFKAHFENKGVPEKFGSMGAGFSIKEGVTTKVIISSKDKEDSNCKISTEGFQSDKTDVSEFVLNEFLKMGKFDDVYFDIQHKISIPVGYGLGSSGAVALSLAYALDKVLQTKLDRTEIGKIAHNAEVSCKTGLGDVLASYHGGFEIRVKPGAPGIGQVEKIDASNISVIMICFSPISTNRFIQDQLSKINGLGGKMVNRLLESKNYENFQDMSLEFAKYIDVMTPRMEKLIDELSENGIKCGVALFGETIFSMIPTKFENKVLEIFNKYPEGKIITSQLDVEGARVLNN
ncbi:MAG: GHMP kinase [Nitrosopumilaceae archaeon]|jgi:pantoate kinase|uniref:GHMP kinase n=2 Tax=Candidatus Nitrosomaritimum aestuariumsis TaxID=3342354 RepID=A0AC60W9B1_9ARCH|nr:GHMP kinase [Nitrosopumilaceae archaeon]MBA4459371.1 GHMP kinase [Nitrosopumilaceae archaeon]MBA4461304.1 GHMP kinase [Nitrosopumilaceae archaeon]MBA4463296.1 GHMP kinase [Nitrosopumilaceae archaeon]